LWPQIPHALETLLMRLLAKNPDDRATLADVRQVLSSLKPTVTAALDRVVDAPPPVRIRKHRHVVRLAAVAVTFLCLVGAGYRPHRLRAQQLGIVPQPAASSVAAAAPLPAKSTTPVAGQTIPAIAAEPPASPSPRVTPRRVKKSHRDSNYLLDPFAR
jgi:hypothetical protein